MAADRLMERPLGPQEALFGELCRRANGAVQLTCIAAFDRPVEAERLRSGLRVVHERHPMLRARMQDRDRLWWVCDVPFERIDIRMQAPRPAVDLEALYAAEAGTPLDVSAVSWRAVCVTDELGSVAWLALTTNHAAIDARSALVVLNDLDRLLGEPVTCPGPPLPLMPYAEAGLAEAGLTGEGGLYHPWPEETKWAVEQPADSAARRPRALLRVFPKPDLDALHDRIHREGLTLAAVFCAAAARAGSALPGHRAWTGILATMDVRGDCRPAVPADAVGEYVASISLLLGPEHQALSPIETVRQLNQQLKDNRPQALRMTTNVSPACTREQADRFGSENRVFSGGICVSDVGDLDRLSGRRVGISRILLMPSQNHGVHPIMVAIVSTSEGACLSFGYDEPLRSRRSARAFADRYLDALTQWTQSKQ